MFCEGLPFCKVPNFQKYRSQSGTKIKRITIPRASIPNAPFFPLYGGQGPKSTATIEPKELQFDLEMHHNLHKSPSWAYRWVPDLPQRSQLFGLCAKNLISRSFLTLLSDKNVWISDGFSHFSRVGGMRWQPLKFHGRFLARFPL